LAERVARQSPPKRMGGPAQALRGPSGDRAALAKRWRSEKAVCSRHVFVDLFEGARAPFSFLRVVRSRLTGFLQRIGG